MFLKALGTFLLIPTFAFCQAESNVELLSDPFNETVRDAAQISGARLVGVTILGQLGKADDKVSVSAAIPAAWNGQDACLRVVTADGLYESMNVYRISPNREGGIESLVYDTRQLEKLKETPPDRVAAIFLNGQCEDSSGEVTPVLWGYRATGDIRLLLNTARAQETYMSFPDFPKFGDVECELAEDGARNAFDTVCVLPEQLASEASVDVDILSFRNGEMGETLRFTVLPGELR